MSRKLRYRTQFSPDSSKQPVREGDMSTKTVQEGQEITVYSLKVPADKVFHWGYGSRSTDDGLNAFVYFDADASGSGAASSAGDPITGDLVLAVTDSTQEDVLARRTIEDLSSLADAANDARTERPVLPELAPSASEDRHLEIRIKADAAADGYEFDPSESDCLLYYGEANTR